MAEGDNKLLKGILTGLAVIGGAFLFSEMINKSKKKKVMFHCPVCDELIEKNTNPCPYCNSELKWPDE